MATVNCYLSFDGTCEAAFNFYKSAFGGEFCSVYRYSDMPPSEHVIPESDQNKIMHISLPVSMETMLMGCDMSDGYTAGNNVSICISPETAEEAQQLYDALSEGGSIIMPLEKTFWAALFAMFTDPFGITWLISFEG